MCRIARTSLCKIKITVTLFAHAAYSIIPTIPIIYIIV